MNSKPIVPRQFANQDVEEAIAYYLEQNATDAALGFIDELERAYRQLTAQNEYSVRFGAGTQWCTYVVSSFKAGM